MLAHRQERLPKQMRRTYLGLFLGRVASVFALVAGLSGAGVAAAQSGSTGAAFGATDSSALLSVVDGSAEAQLSASFGERLRALQTVRQPAFYDDGDNKESEEAEEGQEDGLLPGGQAEQRGHGLGDKTEAKDEDHENCCAQD